MAHFLQKCAFSKNVVIVFKKKKKFKKIKRQAFTQNSRAFIATQI